MNAAQGSGEVSLPQYSPQYYAFTQTLNNRVLGRKLAPVQYDLTYQHVIDQYRKSTGGAITCIAELTEAGDVHYHGVITAPGMCLDKTRYRVSQCNKSSKLLGFKKIKLCDDVPGWVTYITKSLALTYELLGRRPIVCDQFGLIPTGQFKSFGIE